ncbi:MAG: hypothetical protein AAB354_12795 [candidate division KSB1 bacterium]
MASSTPSEKRLSFDEFKLFYESTEKVTDRRHETNKWNYSICVATLVAIAGIIDWGLSRPHFLLVAIIATVMLCLMAALFCSLWIGQILDFKKLNNAKFEVLNQMAPQLAFGSSPLDAVVSYSPFVREWDLLKQAEALEEVNSIKLLALKSSKTEYLIPKAFRLLFVGILLITTLSAIINRAALLDSALSVPSNAVVPH